MLASTRRVYKLTSKGILTQHWEEVGRSGGPVGEDELEHGEGEEDGDPQRHLLARVGRQPEHEQRQRHDHDARRQDVEPVVRRLPRDEQVKCHL